MKRILRPCMVAVMLGCLVSMTTSCKDDPEDEITTGTVNGTVTDDAGAPLGEVTVTVSGVDATATTDANGKYTVSGVSIDSHSVKFAKTGYQTVSVSITAEKFDANKVATADAVMINASAKITGTVTDGNNGGAPLAGVTVSITADATATTGADGVYVIENLVADSYTVTFTKADYLTITRNVAKTDFVDGTATVNVTMGGSELLRGLTADDLSRADKWYYSEYRGGATANEYPHWDWACDYMCALTFWGTWQEQNEGTTLQIRNDADNQANPADLNMFDSYTYGSKLITEDNKILSLRVRTHDADDAAPAHFGVQVVDLSAAEPMAQKVGETKTYGSDQYADFHFDLSAYIGKEVIVAIGIYREQTGDYWKQLVLRRIAFAQENVVNWDWIPGTEVVTGWRLTQQMVRSTMVHTKKSFTGVSSMSASNNLNPATGYPAVYRSWRDIAHIGYEWAFYPTKKDPEVTPAEGYIIKTNGGGTPVNTEVPQAFFYSKYAIAAGCNKLTFKTRNFGSNYTFFKITAIKDDGTITHLTPASNTAQEASAADDGCWKFKHDGGNAGDPEGYASFEYDLSEFNGNNVVLVFGVYKGDDNGDENKLCFYSVDLK